MDGIEGYSTTPPCHSRGGGNPFRSHSRARFSLPQSRPLSLLLHHTKSDTTRFRNSDRPKKPQIEANSDPKQPQNGFVFGFVPNRLPVFSITWWLRTSFFHIFSFGLPTVLIVARPGAVPRQVTITSSAKYLFQQRTCHRFQLPAPSGSTLCFPSLDQRPTLQQRSGQRTLLPPPNS